MALWKELGTKDAPGQRETVTPFKDTTGQVQAETPAAPAPAPASRTPGRTEMKESLLSAGLTIEGKVEGSGHVRIGGRFKGDVNVDGTLTIEPGAHVAGSVRAGSVVVGGELEGNIEAASRVELQPTGVVNGDVNAGSLTVAAGAKMRGRVEFGWTEHPGVTSKK